MKAEFPPLVTTASSTTWKLSFSVRHCHCPAGETAQKVNLISLHFNPERFPIALQMMKTRKTRILLTTHVSWHDVPHSLIFCHFCRSPFDPTLLSPLPFLIYIFLKFYFCTASQFNFSYAPGIIKTTKSALTWLENTESIYWSLHLDLLLGWSLLKAKSILCYQR